tara:strand:+ start:894 stop:1100 length:207 start_codon:yes stop_codon:yes gene_type:complete
LIEDQKEEKKKWITEIAYFKQTVKSVKNTVKTKKVNTAPLIHKINIEKEKLKKIKLKIAPLFSQYRDP